MKLFYLFFLLVASLFAVISGTQAEAAVKSRSVTWVTLDHGKQIVQARIDKGSIVDLPTTPTVG